MTAWGFGFNRPFKPDGKNSDKIKYIKNIGPKY